MTDREIFRENLNYYLNKTGKMQKDLAEGIGIAYTTVSGWTRGISYPRADAMEKIAMFFGIQTSQLVGKRDESDETVDSEAIKPNSEKVRLLMEGINKLNPEQVEQATEMFRIMFANSFKKGTDE